VFRRRPAIACVVIGLAVLFLPTPARSGEHEKPEAKPYALIFGTVWDPDGHALYAVKVKIRRADEKKVRWEIYSNHTGEFAQRVPPGPGDYVIWADVKGYKLPSGKHLQAGPDATVHIDGDERTDVGLHLTW